MESLKPCDFPGNRDLYCAVPSPVNLDEGVSPFGRRPLIFFCSGRVSPPPAHVNRGDLWRASPLDTPLTLGRKESSFLQVFLSEDKRLKERGFMYGSAYL